MRLVAIDFETANAHPESACAVGIVVFEDGIEVDSLATLIRPPRKYDAFDWRNIQIHHIRPKDVRNAPGFDTVYRWLEPYFSDSVFAAHNADFDMTVLDRCCQIYGLATPDLTYFCTVRLTQRMFPYLKHHRLNDCCEYMGIELDHHNAKSDAEGCAQIVLNCMIVADELDLNQFLTRCQVPLKQLGWKKMAKERADKTARKTKTRNS